MKQTQGEGEELGGSSICVQDVEAPKVRVFGVLLHCVLYCVVLYCCTIS